MVIAITVHASVVSLSEQRVDAVFDHGTYAAFTKFVAKSFGIIATVTSKDSQVPGVTPGALRAHLVSRSSVGDC